MGLLLSLKNTARKLDIRFTNNTVTRQRFRYTTWPQKFILGSNFFDTNLSLKLTAGYRLPPKIGMFDPTNMWISSNVHMMFRTKSFLNPCQTIEISVSMFIPVHCRTCGVKFDYLTILSFIEEHGEILLFRRKWNLVQSKFTVHSQVFLYIYVVNCKCLCIWNS